MNDDSFKKELKKRHNKQLLPMEAADFFLKLPQNSSLKKSLAETSSLRDLSFLP